MNRLAHYGIVFLVDKVKASIFMTNRQDRVSESFAKKLRKAAGTRKPGSSFVGSRSEIERQRHVGFCNNYAIKDNIVSIIFRSYNAETRKRGSTRREIKKRHTVNVINP